MDEIKKKIEALTPQNAFYAVAGMLALMLILFLVGDVIEASKDKETLSFSGWACMTGMKYEIFGITAKITIGAGAIFAWLYVVVCAGLIYLTYSQKIVNYMYCIAPVVVLFIMKFAATFKFTATVMGKTKSETADGVSAGMTAMFWIIIVINVALVAFAYFRGNNPVSHDNK